MTLADTYDAQPAQVGLTRFMGESQRQTVQLSDAKWCVGARGIRPKGPCYLSL